jgi:hypothetical protein
LASAASANSFPIQGSSGCRETSHPAAAIAPRKPATGIATRDRIGDGKNAALDIAASSTAAAATAEGAVYDAGATEPGGRS